jgi:hypothetical protein
MQGLEILFMPLLMMSHGEIKPVAPAPYNPSGPSWRVLFLEFEEQEMVPLLSLVEKGQRSFCTTEHAESAERLKNALRSLRSLRQNAKDILQRAYP